VDWSRKKQHGWALMVCSSNLKSTLESGEVIMISGFGRFRVKQKTERRGRNLATGKDMMLAPRKVVTFKWSGKLKDKLN
jgi:integration host factor subunit alpha